MWVVQSQSVETGLENGICGVNYMHCHPISIIQWYAGSYRCCEVLAIGGVLPSRDVHYTEKGPTMDTQVEPYANFELLITSCIIGNGYWLNWGPCKRQEDIEALQYGL